MELAKVISAIECYQFDFGDMAEIHNFLLSFMASQSASQTPPLGVED